MLVEWSQNEPVNWSSGHEIRPVWKLWKLEEKENRQMRANVDKIAVNKKKIKWWCVQNIFNNNDQEYS